MDHDDAVPVVTATNNQKYVDRGRMLAVCDDQQRGRELMDANRHKHGAPFRYTESLIMQLAVIRTVCQLPYRALEGMASEMLHDDVPSYSQIFRRMQAVKVDVSGGVATAANGSGRTAMFWAVDGTGLKQHNRG